MKYFLFDVEGFKNDFAIALRCGHDKDMAAIKKMKEVSETFCEECRNAALPKAFVRQMERRGMDIRDCVDGSFPPFWIGVVDDLDLPSLPQYGDNGDVPNLPACVDIPETAAVWRVGIFPGDLFESCFVMPDGGLRFRVAGNSLDVEGEVFARDILAAVEKFDAAQKASPAPGM